MQTSTGPVSQVPAKKDGQYYKNVQLCKKDIGLALKELKVKHIDEAVQKLRQAVTLLEPYVSTRLMMAQNGGVRRDSARFAGDVAACQKSCETAIGELDYSMIDNAYSQLITALAYIAPFGSA